MLIEIYDDFNIPYSTHGRNCKEGWVNTTCPYCDDTSNHLGGHIMSGVYNCWKCGRHDRAETLSKLLGLPLDEVFKILKKYRGGSKRRTKDAIRTKPDSLKMPNNLSRQLLKRHAHYLLKRGFDPVQVKREWKIRCAGSKSFLHAKGKSINFKNRIIIPIYWKGSVVSYQSRDVTNTSDLRYMACPADLELINHKRIYYSHPKIGKVGICVEGITDVWRLGANAFAMFGIQFTDAQINAVVRDFKKVFILFDNEPAAQRQAGILQDRLSFRNVDCHNISKMLKNANDPAELKPKRVNKILREIGLCTP